MPSEKGPTMGTIPRDLIEAAATFDDMASGEEINELERAIERGEYDDVRADALVEHWGR